MCVRLGVWPPPWGSDGEEWCKSEDAETVLTWSYRCHQEAQYSAINYRTHCCLVACSTLPAVTLTSSAKRFTPPPLLQISYTSIDSYGEARQDVYINISAGISLWLFQTMPGSQAPGWMFQTPGCDVAPQPRFQSDQFSSALTTRVLSQTTHSTSRVINHYTFQNI